MLRIIVSLCIVIVCAHAQADFNAGITDDCLGCICEAASGCDTSTQCIRAGFCGPFHISWPYWADAGKLSIQGATPDDAYSSCANDVYCAADTVRAYMKKFPNDCNGDGKIDCQDYAMIHIYGGYGCGGSQEGPFFTKFRTCRAKLANTLG